MTDTLRNCIIASPGYTFTEIPVAATAVFLMKLLLVILSIISSLIYEASDFYEFSSIGKIAFAVTEIGQHAAGYGCGDIPIHFFTNEVDH